MICQLLYISPFMKTKQGRAAQARKVDRLRNGIIGFAVVVAALVVGYGLFYSAGGTGSGDFVEGEHYRLLEDPPRRRPGDPIVVTEFFSYACIHCKNFQPLLEDWASELPDEVRFERSAASFSAAWAMLAKTYFALEQMDALDTNHERIFRAIHDNGREFRTLAEIADFVAGRGIERQAFVDAYNSPEVRRKSADEDARQRRLGIASTPALVVAERYVVDVRAGRRQALETVDYLIDLIRDQ